MDTDQRTDLVWLLGIQRKLYQWSRENPDEPWREMWNWVTDLRNLRCAWRRIATNKGKRSAGIDGMTVSKVRARTGEAQFLEALRTKLRNGGYRPSPSRRKLIPKLGQLVLPADSNLSCDSNVRRPPSPSRRKLIPKLGQLVLPEECLSI